TSPDNGSQVTASSTHTSPSNPPLTSTSRSPTRPRASPVTRSLCACTASPVGRPRAGSHGCKVPSPPPATTTSTEPPDLSLLLRPQATRPTASTYTEPP